MRSLLGALLLAAVAGCARDPGLCCDGFSPTEDAGVYCHAHKDAVLRFVRAGSDPGERRGRLEWFKGVLQDLEPLADSDAIHERLSRHEKTRAEFWKEYDQQHFWAGRDTVLGLERRGELMKCGFRHAVYLLGRELP